MRLFNVFSALLSATAALAADTDAWKGRSIYFALTDRIERNNGDQTRCNNLGNYCGGTFRGIQTQLDYIQGMGFDAIWITPPVDSKSLDFFSTAWLNPLTLQTTPTVTTATGPATYTASTPTTAPPRTSRTSSTPLTAEACM
jgi:hypothetical protein